MQDEPRAPRVGAAPEGMAPTGPFHLPAPPEAADPVGAAGGRAQRPPCTVPRWGGCGAMGTPGCGAGWRRLPGSSAAEPMGKLRHGEAAAGPYGAHVARLGAGRNASPCPPRAFQLQLKAAGPGAWHWLAAPGRRGAGAGGGAALAVPAGRQPGHSGLSRARRRARASHLGWELGRSPGGSGPQRATEQPLLPSGGGWAQRGGSCACARTRVHVHACVRARVAVCLLRREHRCPQSSPCWCHPPLPKKPPPRQHPAGTQRPGTCSEPAPCPALPRNAVAFGEEEW